MLRLWQQILVLMAGRESLFDGLGDLVKKPYDYGRLLSAGDRGVRRALARLEAQGLVSSQGKRGRASWRLTRDGKSLAEQVRPGLYGEGQSWDGKWRVVVFDIPERYRGMRTVLRRFLKSMGFGQFQRSLWITPFAVGREVKVFIKASRLSEMAFLLEASKISGGGPEHLADRIWGLDKLSQRYEAMAMEWERGQTITKAHKKAFERLVFGDPLLPKELLPKGFGREKALRVYGRLAESGAG